MDSKSRFWVRAAGAAVMLVLWGATWTGTSRAGDIRDDRSQSQYLSLGASADYASVGHITEGTSGGTYLGSGILVAPDWVLTAAHMVDDATSITFKLGNQNYTGDSWLANPSWTGDLGAGYDIGLIHLTTPISSIAAATRYTGKSELGGVGTFVGYGMSGTGLTGAKFYDYQKRAGQNVVDTYWSGTPSTARILMVDFDNPRNRRDSHYGSSTPLNLEYLIAPGDSGGGVFESIGGSNVLIGVNSFGASYDGKTNFDYGDVSGFTRVSMFNSWIDSIINGTASATSTSAGGPTATFVRVSAPLPEPSSLILCGIGALSAAALAWRQRRRIAAPC